MKKEKNSISLGFLSCRYVNCYLTWRCLTITWPCKTKSDKKVGLKWRCMFRSQGALFKGLQPCDNPLASIESGYP